MPLNLLRRKPRSLFGQILDWMLTALLLLWPVSLVTTWLLAQSIANHPFDRALTHRVSALAQFIAEEHDSAQFSLRPSVQRFLQTDGIDQVYFQIRTGDGLHLAGEARLPLPTAQQCAGPEAVHLRDARMGNEALRVACVILALASPHGPPALIQVAQTTHARTALVADIVKGMMAPQLVLLPLAVALVWLALWHATRPLKRLQGRIRARSPDDLSPLDLQGIPTEIAPLMGSINDLLVRLSVSMRTQKRFLADAAHQLKTPLAGLRMQADLALRAPCDSEEIRQSLHQIQRASINASHTVSQLLSLARAESGAAMSTLQTCDLAQITLEVTRECSMRALTKHLDLGYEGPQPGSDGVCIAGNPTLLREMVRNLLDNAMTYTPSSAQSPGVITARVLTEPLSKAVIVQVQDCGPGIAAAERQQIFLPFYRILGTEADGSGLGLPIVAEIARQHHGSVSVQDSHPDHAPPGACFTVRFTRP